MSPVGQVGVHHAVFCRALAKGGARCDNARHERRRQLHHQPLERVLPRRLTCRMLEPVRLFHPFMGVVAISALGVSGLLSVLSWASPFNEAKRRAGDGSDVHTTSHVSGHVSACKL